MQTLISLLLQEQSDQGFHCLNEPTYLNTHSKYGTLITFKMQGRVGITTIRVEFPVNTDTKSPVSIQCIFHSLTKIVKTLIRKNGNI